MGPLPMVNGIDHVLNGLSFGSGQVLFLYTSPIDKYAIQELFFASDREDERLVYVTCEDSEFITNKFSKSSLRPLVIHPEKIDDMKTMEGKLRVINDGVSSYEILEEFLAGNENYTSLCMYDLAMIEPKRLKKLVASHDKMILNTADMTVLSAGYLKKTDVTDAAIERFVKEYLDIVVLALIASKPMCGTDIMDTVHRNFNVLLSPGTIYPLLHRLRNEGLLEFESGFKKKVYKPTKGSKADIDSIINEHLLTTELIKNFLKSMELKVGYYECE